MIVRNGKEMTGDTLETIGADILLIGYISGRPSRTRRLGSRGGGAYKCYPYALAKSTRRPRLWRPGESQLRLSPRHDHTLDDHGEEPGSRAKIVPFISAECGHLTSFLAWLAADRSRKSGLYFASDSRVTFIDGSFRDDCVKLFCPSTSPEIFGMLGRDITFPKNALPTICAQIDQGRIPQGLATSMYGRIDWVLCELKKMKALQPGGGDFTIFHASRNSYDVRSTFALTRHQFVGSRDIWLGKDYDLDSEQSHAIVFDGSGQQVVSTAVTPLTIAIGSVSRVYFEGFCNALKSPCPDPFSGGAPQLLGLGSSGVGRHYGVQTTTGTFFRSLPASFNDVPKGTQWRNETFLQVGLNGPMMKNRRRKLIKGKRRPPKQV